MKKKKKQTENDDEPQQADGRLTVHNAEQALAAAETVMRQKLSPVALRTMGAFAKYAHEEETGAFTLKDKKKLMRRTARHNWKIAKFLFRKRKGGEVDEMHADGKNTGGLFFAFLFHEESPHTHTRANNYPIFTRPRRPLARLSLEMHSDFQPRAEAHGRLCQRRGNHAIPPKSDSVSHRKYVQATRKHSKREL